jgi:hypothetical protein
MEESRSTTRTRSRTRPEVPFLGAGVPGAPAPAAVSCTVMHGPYAENLPVGGMSVGQVRTRFRTRFDIHPDAQAIVDGHEASEDTILQPGQLLAFVRFAGEKGRPS